MKPWMSMFVVLFLTAPVFAHVKDVTIQEYGSSIKITFMETETKLERIDFIRKADIVVVSLMGEDLNHPFLRIIRKGHYPEDAKGTDFHFDRDEWEEAKKMLDQVVAIVFGDSK
ncbi:MAG: hypothetical protein KJ645_09620 [Planctomycetes bacterium]|nr:hypothetical protein [Planctomycetota bacterium]